VVRGPAPVLSWTPPRLEPATDDTLMRLLELYRHTDAEMARALEERIGLAAIARAGGMDMTPGQARPAGAAQVRAYFAESAGSAAKFMARPDGPRVGAIAFDGWDTHANEGAVNGRLAALLGALDGAIAALEPSYAGYSIGRSRRESDWPKAARGRPGTRQHSQQHLELTAKLTDLVSLYCSVKRPLIQPEDSILQLTAMLSSAC